MCVVFIIFFLKFLLCFSLISSSGTDIYSYHHSPLLLGPLSLPLAAACPCLLPVVLVALPAYVAGLMAGVASFAAALGAIAGDVAGFVAGVAALHGETAAVVAAALGAAAGDVAGFVAIVAAHLRPLVIILKLRLFAIIFQVLHWRGGVGKVWF